MMMKYTLFYIKSIVPFLTAELSLKKAIFRTCCQVGAERFEWFMSHFAACECSVYKNLAFYSEVMVVAASAATITIVQHLCEA